jgi:hypothetical protein
MPIGPFVGSTGKIPLTEFLGVVILFSKLLKINDKMRRALTKFFGNLIFCHALESFSCIPFVGVTEGRHGFFLVTLDLRQSLLPISKKGLGGAALGNDIRT